MNFLERAKAAVSAFRGSKTSQRGYREVIAVGGQNDDWALDTVGEDSKIWQNIFYLRARMRDLFDTNPYFSKYRELIWANVFGEKGIMLRMKVKETEDRVVNSPDERAFIKGYEERRNRVAEWVASRDGREWIREQHGLHLLREFGTNGSRVAQIKVGAPDVYANEIIERRWDEWQRAENCDARGRRPYSILRQLRLLSCARDGDFFIRLIRDPKVNKFGFALQMINAEWVDYFYNATLPNGNVVRMGIEYQNNSWGIGKPVAYYFIKRQPQDWQFSIPGAFNFNQGNMHDRVPASEIIHYARYTDADSTRPAPWGSSTIFKARQLDQFELYEVIAARASACKTGWLYSDLVPEGGDGFQPPDPRGIRNLKTEAGGIYGLPWGVKYQESDPTHPNGNFEEFRKGQLRSWCAGMPAADYNTIANDLEGINFSAGRLGRLDTNEMSKLIQNWDIDMAERPIFEAWLEMALTTGAVPLPLAKFQKFNKPVFSGRRWAQVDEIKAVNAAALRVANHMSTLSKECAELGVDFEDNALERAEEMMLLESLGLKSSLTVEGSAAQEGDSDGEDAEGDTGNTNATTGGTKKPAAKKPKMKNLDALSVNRLEVAPQ